MASSKHHDLTMRDQRKSFSRRSERIHAQVDRMNKTARKGQWVVVPEPRLDPMHLPNLRIVWVPAK